MIFYAFSTFTLWKSSLALSCLQFVSDQFVMWHGQWMTLDFGRVRLYILKCKHNWPFHDPVNSLTHFNEIYFKKPVKKPRVDIINQLYLHVKSLSLFQLTAIPYKNNANYRHMVSTFKWASENLSYSNADSVMVTVDKTTRFHIRSNPGHLQALPSGLYGFWSCAL